MMALLETGLAAWRLAHMLVYEDGPYALLARLRKAVGLRAVVRRGAQGEIVTEKAALTPWAELFACVWCMSVWTAAVLSLPGRVVRWLRRLLAVAAVACLLHELTEVENEQQSSLS